MLMNIADMHDFRKNEIKPCVKLRWAICFATVYTETV